MLQSMPGAIFDIGTGRITDEQKESIINEIKFILTTEAFIMMTVRTNKIDCNGAKFNGTMYSVCISDGKHTANFINDGESALTIDNFTSGTNELNSKFTMTKDDRTLHHINGWGTRKESKQQKADMMDFIDMCLGVAIRFGNGVICYEA